MSFTLLLNSSNVVGSNNSTFQYKFINGSFQIPDGSEMAISQVTIPYSWYNITSRNANNQFTFQWVSATSTADVYTIPDGFYDVTDLNAYIQQLCITNGWYLIDANGNNVYYINFSTNTNYYKVQLLLLVVPTSLPSGWSQPLNFAGYPGTAKTPSFGLNQNNSIASIIGFPSNTLWNFSATSQSILSTTTPNLTPVNSLTMRCSLVNNGITMPSDILDSIPINTTFGSNIIYAPNYEKWVKMNAGTYNNLTLTLTDQSFNTLYSNDPNVAITLLIKIPQNKK